MESSDVSMVNCDVLVVVVDKGASRGPSVGDRCDALAEAEAEKGPVVEVVVLTGDSVSEPLSLGRLSLRSKLRTRELLERLWEDLSDDMVEVMEEGKGGDARGVVIE